MFLLFLCLVNWLLACLLGWLAGWLGGFGCLLGSLQQHLAVCFSHYPGQFALRGNQRGNHHGWGSLFKDTRADASDGMCRHGTVHFQGLRVVPPTSVKKAACSRCIAKMGAMQSSKSGFTLGKNGSPQSCGEFEF